MMQKSLLAASLLVGCECGQLSLTSSNLASPRDKDSFGDLLIGGVKATFDRVLHVGSEDVKLSAKFEADDFADLHSPSNFKEVSASGSYALDVPLPGWNTHADRDPFKLRYQLAHKIENGLTALKMSATTYGAQLKARADSSGAVALESVSYGYGVKAAGTDITVDNEFEFHGRWGADSVYKFALGGWGVTTSVSQPFSPVMPDLEVATSHEVSAGRTIGSSVTVGPESGGGVYSDAKISYTDTAQQGAVWEAALSQPLTKLRGTKLTMKRSWGF